MATDPPKRTPIGMLKPCARCDGPVERWAIPQNRKDVWLCDRCQRATITAYRHRDA